MAFTHSEVTKLVRGAIAGGMPAGTFKLTAEGGKLTLSPLAVAELHDDAAEMERRMREAFGE